MLLRGIFTCSSMAAWPCDKSHNWLLLLADTWGILWRMIWTRAIRRVRRESRSGWIPLKCTRLQMRTRKTKVRTNLQSESLIRLFHMTVALVNVRYGGGRIWRRSRRKWWPNRRKRWTGSSYRSSGYGVDSFEAQQEQVEGERQSQVLEENQQAVHEIVPQVPQIFQGKHVAHFNLILS